MSFSFPYQFVTIGNKQIPYPIIPVTLTTVFEKRAYGFILDTGADVTTMPHYMLTILGLDEKKLNKSTAMGIGNTPVNIRETTITIRIGTVDFSVPCSFTDNNQTPLLLGKEGLFDTFNIFFNNSKNQVEFVKK
jgi:hypothetical protein